VLFLLLTVKKLVYILLERMLIFPSVLCSPRDSPSGYKLHLRKNHAFLSLNTGWSRYNLPKKFWVIRRI
jgi:hypothetical protein